MTSEYCRVTVQWLFSKKFPNCLKRTKNVVWQSADGRVTSTTVAWPFSDFFRNFPKSLENVQKTLFDSRPTVAWPQPLSRDRSATFLKIFPNRLKRPKNVVWQSADGRVTSDHCRVTVQRLFSNFFLIAWNVPKNVVWQSADGRVTSTTVAWPFSDFFQNFHKSFETSKKRCLTVGRRSRDPNYFAWPFSDFFQNFPKSLETSKKRCLTVSRRSRDLNHCRVTVQRLFFKFFSNCLKRPKTLFDSRPTVARPQPLSRDRSATFLKIFPNRLKRPRNVVWQSSDGRVTSDHCRVTVQRHFSKTFIIAWNVQKTLFDSRPTVAWPPTTVAWPFSDFLNILPNCLKRPKNVVWQSADGRVTSDHCRVTVQRLFSKFSQIAWNVQKTLFDSRPTVAWPPTTVAWPFSDFFQKKF